MLDLLPRDRKALGFQSFASIILSGERSRNCVKATALTNAVWGGHKDVVELLLRREASTDVSGGKFYRTILDYARANSRPEIVSLLENPPR